MQDEACPAASSGAHARIRGGDGRANRSEKNTAVIERTDSEKRNRKATRADLEKHTTDSEKRFPNTQNLFIIYKPTLAVATSFRVSGLPTNIFSFRFFLGVWEFANQICCFGARVYRPTSSKIQRSPRSITGKMQDCRLGCGVCNSLLSGFRVANIPFEGFGYANRSTFPFRF